MYTITTPEAEAAYRTSQIKTPKLESDSGFEGCSIPMMILLSGPRMAMNMAWAAQWAALGPYLESLLPSYAVLLTQFIGPVTGILVAPTVGVLSDKCTSKFGRRRPFLFFGAITSIICWTLMGYTREFGEAMGDSASNRTWTAIFTIFFYLWMDITVNIAATPSMLILADFAGERQTTASGVGQAASTLGALVVSGYIEIFGPAHKTLHEFLALLSVVMFITVGAVCAFAKERPLEKPLVPISTSEQVKKAFQSIWEGIKSLPQQLAVFGIVFFCIQYGFTAYNGAKGQFFGLEVFGGQASGADVCGTAGYPACTVEQDNFNKGVQMAGGSTDMIFSCVGYIFSWLLAFFVSKLGMKIVLIASTIPQALLMVAAFWHYVPVDVTIVVLTSITQNTVFGLLVPIIIHVIGSAEDERLGLYVGALNSANCAGQFLNFAVASGLVNTSLGYQLPVFVGGAMSFVGGVIAIFAFKINSKSL